MSGNGWIRVASLSDLADGETMVVEAAGEMLCLYNLAGRIFATQDLCTHAEASLAEGFIEGDCIECPLHQAKFHIPTGKVLSAPANDDLRVFAVAVRGEDIVVEMPAAEV